MSERFDVKTEYVNSVPVIHLVGEITSETDEDIIKAYDSIDESKRGKVIINFQKTSYLNSAGIATLIGLVTKSLNINGKVFFVGLSSHFKKVMEIVGLMELVTTFETLPDALK